MTKIRRDVKNRYYMKTQYRNSKTGEPKTKISKIDRLKMFAESLGLNPDEVLSRDAMTSPHRTVVDPESRNIEVLNDALKHAILKELRKA